MQDPTHLASEVASGSQTAPERKKRKCAECGEGFVPNRPQQQFCKPEHKRDFQNRAAADGRAIIAFAKVWRLGRNARGKTAEAKRKRDLATSALTEMSAVLDSMLERDRKEGRSTDMAFDYVASLFATGEGWRDRSEKLAWAKRRGQPDT